MSPIIKVLQDSLAKEANGIRIKYDEESGIISLDGKEIGKWNDEASNDYPEDLIWRRDIGDFHDKALKAGHEAATAFWLPLIEKAVEMAEVYALENDPDFIYRCLDEAIEMRNKNPHSKAVFGNATIGKKAREFLLSIRETAGVTLADASGESEKER